MWTRAWNCCATRSTTKRMFDMAVVSTETVPVLSEADVVTVRRRGRETATQLGFGLVDQTKVITAASELARNTLIHGKGGEMIMDTLNGPRVGLRLIFQDKGPGIRDLDMAL